MLRTLPKLALCACLLLAAASLASARISPRLDAPLCSTTFYHPLLAASVQLDAWGNDSIRVRASPDDIHAIPDVQALLPYPPGLTPPADAEWPCKAADSSLSNGNLAVSVSDAGVLTATRLSDNKVLLTTTALSFAPVTFKSIYPSNYSLYQLSVSYTHATGQIYGLGEHKTNRTQYVDFEHLFEDSQIYGDSAGGDLTIPWYISTAGFGLLYNQPGYGYVQITSDQALWQSNATHQLDLWLTTSPADSEGAATPYPALSGNYAEATGHPNALPRFASGFWQSKDRYRNQSEILGITAHFHELEVPVEVFVIDWQHWQYLGDWSFWLPLCWPDPTAMVKQLSSYGMHTMISAWPRVDPRSANYADMSQRGYLTVDAQGKEILGPDGTIIYDAFNPAAREYVWQQLLSGYVQHGIQLFWLDAAEPEQSQPGRQWWSGKSDREVGMAWTVHHLRMIFEGSLSAGIPESQVITLVRHGWVGSALFNAFVWSGDVQSTWDSLGVQVRLAPNVALSGVHWWATDIGGYFGGQWQTSDFQELLVRWFQWGAFLPVFRTHGHREPSEDNGPCGGGGGPNELWTYWHKDEIAAVISLRQEIRPYVEYHLTQASLNGVPIVRPMWYNYTDAECLSAQSEDQYMFGPTWLVAPVLHPLSASKTRSVYLPALPKGELWVNYYTGATDQGGKRVDVALDLATFPLFQRLTREEYSARLQREAEVAVAAVLRQ